MKGMDGLANGNNQPPPSTLAAQIVDNLSRNRTQREGGAVLQDLLTDFLSAGAAAFADTTTSTKSQLVELLLKACRQALRSGSLLDKSDSTADRLVQSLKVVKLAILNAPDILLFQHESSDVSANHQSLEPLFLRVIPQLFNFLGASLNDAVSEATNDILQACKQAELRPVTLKAVFRPVESYLKGCLRDLHDFICSSRAGVKASGSKLVSIPSMITVSTSLPGFKGEKLSFDTVELRLVDALNVAAAMLDMALQKPQYWHNTATRAGAAIMIKSLTTASVKSGNMTANRFVFLNKRILAILSKLVQHSSGRRQQAHAFDQLFAVVCRYANDLLTQKFHPLQSELEFRLCRLVSHCLTLSRTSDLKRQALRHNISRYLCRSIENLDLRASLGSDLQILLVMCCAIVSGSVKSPDQHMLGQVQDTDLRAVLTKELRQQQWTSIGVTIDHQHTAKRMRISQDEDEDIFILSQPRQALKQFLFDIGLRNWDEQSGQLPQDLWRILPRDDSRLQNRLLDLIDRSICERQDIVRTSCSICTDRGLRSEREDASQQAFLDSAFLIVTQLATASPDQMGALATTHSPRIHALHCLQKLLSHSHNPSHTDLMSSALGKWCMHSLGSKNKGIRIAAGKTLKQYVRPLLDHEQCHRNRHIALDLLRQLVHERSHSRDETSIWLLENILDGNPGQDEVLLILFRLIEYLGHRQPLINSLAYEELLRLSNNSSYRAQKILEPYWRFVAISLVKDLIKRPSAIQRICDLTELSVDQLLTMTRIYTVPSLVLTKKSDVLERIATATFSGAHFETGSPVIEVCINSEQLPALLAMLLMHSNTDPGEFIASKLAAVSEGFSRTNVSDLMKSDPVRIAFEIFRYAGDGDDKQIAQAQAAIAFVAEQSQSRQVSSGRRSSRRVDSVGQFFESHSLAILKLLSDVVTEIHCPQVLPERRRCLAGIKQMVTIGGDYAAGAVPQMSACLRSAIAGDHFRDEGFAAWVALIKTLTDISTLVNPTFALIQRYWQHFNSSSQRRAHDLIDWLFRERQDVMLEIAKFLPSIDQIPLLSKYEADIAKIKNHSDPRVTFALFAERLASGDLLVITRTLEELKDHLHMHQSLLQDSSLDERPDPVISRILQALLDATVRFSPLSKEVAALCGKCLGLVGCLDPTKIELSRDQREIIVSSNFTNREETVSFITFFLEEILVKAFTATMNPRSQNFLGFAMQNLLEICNFKSGTGPKGLDESDNSDRWLAFSEDARAVLSPFLNSRYTLLEGNPPTLSEHPIFRAGMRHAEWLRELVYDMLQKTEGENANLVFGICKRIVRGQDLSIASFLLPYVALNVLVGGNFGYKHGLGQEFLAVLIHPLDDTAQGLKDELMLCSQEIFHTLDYFSRWIHQKKAIMSRQRLPQADADQGRAAIQTIEGLIDSIPAEAMSRRAVQCKNFSRGLFYWEQYIRQWKITHAEILQAEPQSGDFLYQKLQDIYVQIEEPDGIEGVSSHLQILDAEQQVLEHRKAGRWTAVQDWNEILLTNDPSNVSYQRELFISLRESGQFESLLDRVSTKEDEQLSLNPGRSLLIEACWSVSRWKMLSTYVAKDLKENIGGFNSGIGAAFILLFQKQYDEFERRLDDLRGEIARGLTKTSIMTLQSCRGTLLHLHAMTDIEKICDIHDSYENVSQKLNSDLERRLDVLGAFPADKQYLLRLRRAAMELSRHHYTKNEIASVWLTSARLHRKQNSMPQSFKAILHASHLGDQTAAVEHARFLWKEGHHRKAIQSLEGAIAAHAFETHTAAVSFDGESNLSKLSESGKQQNITAAKAQLLLAKWLDRAGQTQSESIIKQYQEACSLYTRWEKGQYSLGRHYNKLLESERLKVPGKQSETCITGELAKHVIENYLRSMAYGAKYIYQTLPRILTLWCEMGEIVDQSLDSRYGTNDHFIKHITKRRKQFFDATMSQLKKYIDRLPAFVFYTALNQICARICHANIKVYGALADIVVKVCIAHPQQALWTLFAMLRSKTKERNERGQACIAKVQEQSKRLKSEASVSEVRNLITQGTKITEQLLEVCDADLRKFNKRQSKVNIKDLGFKHKEAAASKLAIPIEATLTASLPTSTDTVNMRQHKAFSKDTITIQSFLDEVTLLSSLVRPRKVDIRGSDGRIYGVLCKPKDDLRLDQRLLEFNGTIKRLLKRDAESVKRRLYVRTYAVTPLNEECGLIEWVEGLKTHRDILLKIYLAKGITPDYRVIGAFLEEAINGDMTKFTETVINMFPPVLHEWFVETFPDPDAWYVARLRYTRSCAVTSMVGHVLGLGDRHSENILIEEGSGGIMHVDFNCLFDKGLTFEKPEKVPFRLTHNMVDAFGAYGCEGPFRRSSELVMAILRQHQDTLMTVLEQFLYDPTIELMGVRKKRAVAADVPNTPEGVLESVKYKVRGLLPKEAVPLSVEGYVEFLIQQARDPFRLASMYIGWCAFL